MPKLIFIFLGIVAILAIGFFLIWPKYQKFESLKVQIENSELDLRQTESFYEKLEKLSEDLEGYQDQLSKIDLALPDNSSFAAISLINFVGNSSGVTSGVNGLKLKKLKSFSITSPKLPVQAPGTPAQPQSKVKDISVDFEVSGSYSALKNFIQTLENSAKIIEVENLSFSVEKEEIPSIDLKIKTFSY
jgi:Tfp pilus assembly protein PilO